MSKPVVPLEFSDLFKVEDYTDDSFLDLNDWPNHGNSHDRDFVGDLFRKAIDKKTDNVQPAPDDCSAFESEEFRKAEDEIVEQLNSRER